MKLFSFKNKLISIFTLMIIVYGIIIAAYSYNYAKSTVINLQKGEIRDNVNRIDININARVRMINKEIDSIAISFADLYNAKNFEKANIIIGKKFSDSGIEKIHFVDKEPSVHFMKWGNLESVSLTEGPEEKIIRVIRPFKDELESKNGGYLIFDINPKIFNDLMLKEHTSSQNLSYILDKNNQIIASNNSNIKEQLLPQSIQLFERGKQNFELNLKGESFYGRGQFNGLTGWKTFTIANIDNIFPQSQVLKDSITFIVIILTVNVFVLIILISNILTRPVNQLIRKLDLVEEDNYYIQINHKRKDEIGRLIDAINYMMRKIKKLVIEVYEKDLEQQKAELKALQAQINPHFLYNTLDSINWMLLSKEDYDTSKVVVSLGEIMKYAIDNNNMFVPLEEELSYLESYLTIQKNRLEEKLEYSIEYDNSVSHINVPKLIIQPIVENAVIHGMEEKDSINISVKAFSDNKVVRIIVLDNGKGMEETELRKIEEGVNNSSIGIQNVNRRLELFYGSEYRLLIESRINEGTKVIYRIPRRES